MFKILRITLCINIFVFSFFSNSCSGMEVLSWITGNPKGHKLLLQTFPQSSSLFSSIDISSNYAFVSPQTFTKLFGEEAEVGYIRLTSEFIHNKSHYQEEPQYSKGVIAVKRKVGIRDNSQETPLVYLNSGLAKFVKSIESAFNPTRENTAPISFVTFPFTALGNVRSCTFDITITTISETDSFEISQKVLEGQIKNKFSGIVITNGMLNLEFIFDEHDLGISATNPNGYCSIGKICAKLSAADSLNSGYLGADTRIRMNINAGQRIKFIQYSHKDPGGTSFSDLIPPRPITAVEALYGNHTNPGVQRSELFAPDPFPKRKLSAADIESIVASSETDDIQIKTLNLDFNALGIGGLDEQLTALVRDTVLSRGATKGTLERLGITEHAKGILLYGPPGTGKTLIARQIGKMLGVEGDFFRVINGPEILDKYVGGSEEKLRQHFEFAERNPTKLVVLFIDEIDSIAGKRSEGSGASTNVNNNLVNTLLTKMDGIDGIKNILVIGATNRPDMLDGALMREGRFSTQLEIGLPDEKGRKDIFNIKLQDVIENGALKDVDISVLVELTANYTGAEITGFCDRARKFALAEAADNPEDLSAIDSSAVFITQAHFISALAEMRPSFAQYSTVTNLLPEAAIALPSQQQFARALASRVKSFRPGAVYSYLITGKKKIGKSSSVGAFITETKEYFDFTRVFKPNPLRKSFSDELTQAWRDSQRFCKSLIVLDDLHNLLGIINGGEYDRSAMRFLNTLLQSSTDRNKKTGQRNQTVVLATMSDTSKDTFSYINPTISWSYEESFRENSSPTDIMAILTQYNVPESLQSSLVPLLAKYPLSTILDICNEENTPTRTLPDWKSHISELLGEELDANEGDELEEDL